MTRQLVILGTSVTLPDPGSVTDLAARFQQQGGQLADLETTLQSLTKPDAWGDWTGLAADAFGQSIGQLPAELGGVRDAYEVVAAALQQYAGQLEPVVSSLSSLSLQAEDAESTLTAVRNARSQAIAHGQDPATAGWDARLADATAVVSGLRGQLTRLLDELTALAGTCTKKIKAAEPTTARKSLFGELESYAVRDVADPLGHGVIEAGKSVLDGGKIAGHLLDDMFVQPFFDLKTALVNLHKDPDLHTLGEALEASGNALGAVALAVGVVAVVVALTAVTGGTADIALLGTAGALGDAADALGSYALYAHEGGLVANTGAVVSHEDGATGSQVESSLLSVVTDKESDVLDGEISDDGGDWMDVHESDDAFGIVTSFGGEPVHVQTIPQPAAAAPGVVSGLDVAAGSVQGLQGLPVSAGQAVGSAAILQPAVSVASPAVVNVQHVALSPQPGGAPGSGGSGPEGDM